ncbi:hypothetical protein HMI49_13870 [Corallococcus exercitus]|uniref:Uncharacterized protein n=1 Tax=Corallococcus exercitus TaxID=2316736 RepID=A0A7Y4KI90_9BACT|nr:hypothetical protein [Corallococcus exercitus]NOK34285.1 hypothetical protein [Corallococcus exercitus]
MARAIGLAAAVLCLSACGDGPDVYALSFSLHSNRVRAAREPVPPPEYSFESADGVTFHVDSAFITLFDVRLELPPGVRCAEYQDALSPRMTCEDAMEGQPGRLTVASPLELDLRQGLTVAGGGLPIPPGVYPRIEARLRPGTPTEPSFRSRSSFTWQGQPHVLELDFQSDAALRFEPRGSLDFASAEHGSGLLGWLLVDAWLGETPVGACLASGDLPLTGNLLRLETGQGACAGAAEQVRGNIEASGMMGLSPRS